MKPTFYSDVSLHVAWRARCLPFADLLDGRQHLLDVVLGPAAGLGAARSSRHLGAVMIHLQMHLKNFKTKPQSSVTAAVSRDFIKSVFPLPLTACCVMTELLLFIYLSSYEGVVVHLEVSVHSGPKTLPKPVVLLYFNGIILNIFSYLQILNVG